MKDASTQMAWAAKTSAKVAMLLSKRLQHANAQYRQRLQEVTTQMAEAQPRPQDAMQTMARSVNYAIDAMQRSILVADTLRERGNDFIAHEQAGKPPLLHFDYEVVLDARHFERPANCALVRINAPAGVKVDPKRRPYIIIDPRAGHAPGIGGFKDDSQVGVALAGIRSGGFSAAVARAAVLLARHGEPLPLARVSRNREMRKDYAGLLPDMAPDQWRRLRGEQEIIIAYAPQDAVATLPELLADPGDRDRFRALFEQLLHDPRLIGQGATDEQQTMLRRIEGVLGARPAPKTQTRRRAARKAAGKGACK